MPNQPDSERALPYGPTTPRKTTAPGRKSGAASMPEQSATLAVVLEQIQALGREMSLVREDVRRAQAQSVPRGEWELNNAHVDDRFRSLGREIGKIQTDISSRRVPWTAVVGGITGIGALLIVLIQAVN